MPARCVYTWLMLAIRRATGRKVKGEQVKINLSNEQRRVATVWHAFPRRNAPRASEAKEDASTEKGRLRVVAVKPSPACTSSAARGDNFAMDWPCEPRHSEGKTKGEREVLTIDGLDLVPVLIPPFGRLRLSSLDLRPGVRCIFFFIRRG